MPQLRIATINILSDLSLWEKRRPLLLSGLAELDADLIALQEASIPENNALWLAGKLNMQHIHLSQKTGEAGEREGIAILSRIPFEELDTLDLRYQNRVAQYVRVRIQGRPLVVANGHFYWQPGDAPQRLEQINWLLEWLDANIDQEPLVICGDFNGEPDTAAIRRMRERLDSAYALTHNGHEPEYTTPTPLPRSRRAMLRTLLRFLPDLRLGSFELNWRGTLDYIFVNSLVKVSSCRVVLNQPDPQDPKIYPSDHFGLFAEIEI